MADWKLALRVSKYGQSTTVELPSWTLPTLPYQSFPILLMSFFSPWLTYPVNSAAVLLQRPKFPFTAFGTKKQQKIKWNKNLVSSDMSTFLPLWKLRKQRISESHPATSIRASPRWEYGKTGNLTGATECVTPHTPNSKPFGRVGQLRCTRQLFRSLFNTRACPWIW